MNASAIKQTDTNFVPSTNFVPISEAERAEEFAGELIPFPAKDLARASSRSVETAKQWKAGRRFPNGESLMALMAAFPTINAWVLRKTGGIHSPQALSTAFALLEQIMQSDTAEGRAMRARFQEIQAERAR